MAELTGRHVLAITTGAFAIIIGVNVVMAWKAVSTFPGLEVGNSYVASQTWDAERKAQEALGWTLAYAYDPAKGELALIFRDAGGVPVNLAALAVLVGRPTEAKDDQTPAFAEGTDGAYRAPVRLAPGKWMLQVEARAADGTLFRQRIDLQVGG
jgi:nitrogen fixation protein FixH